MTARNPGLYYDQTLNVWVASVDLPRGIDGRRRKLRRTSKNRGTAERLLRELRAEVTSGQITVTSTPTVAEWMTYWLAEIAASRVTPKTLAGYRSSTRQTVIPAIGKIKLGSLAPAHVRRMHAHVEARSLSTSTAQQAHAALRKALSDAQTEGLVRTNVASVVDAPRSRPSTRSALTVAEAQSILHTVADDRLGARWALALLLGLRRGEAIGLELDRATGGQLVIDWQLQRLKMRHGCARKLPANGMWPCGRTRGGSCPAAKAEVHNPAYEYRQLEGGLHLVRPKSRQGWRVLPLPPGVDEIVARRVDVAEREPNPHGLLFTRDPLGDEPLWGRPISPELDTASWGTVTARAGITRAGTLHEARHTTATLLQAIGVDESTRIEILGHSSITTTRGYEHVPLGLRQAAIGKLADVLITPTSPSSRALPAAVPAIGAGEAAADDGGDPDLVAITRGWRGNVTAATGAITHLATLGVQTVIVTGGLGALAPGRHGRTYDQVLTDVLAEHAVRLVLVDGPGDHLPRIHALPTTTDGRRQLLPGVTWVPRGYTWTWHGRTVTAVGGGHTPDGVGIEGLDRWADLEGVTTADVADVPSRPDLLVTVTSPTSDTASGQVIAGLVDRMSPGAVVHTGDGGLSAGEVELWDVITNARTRIALDR